VDDDETTRLRRAVARLTRALNAAATGEGLTPAQSSMLALVGAGGRLPVAEIIRLEGLNPSMASRVLGKLEDAGLIRRAPGSTDQRTVLVEATAAGRRTHQRIKDRRNALVTECLARLPVEQATALSRALPALEALVDELTEHP
jgi:DNA-binding MarR family transcriptional regulator